MMENCIADSSCMKIYILHSVEVGSMCKVIAPRFYFAPNLKIECSHHSMHVVERYYYIEFDEPTRTEVISN